jgi:hypothetical protein
MFLEVESGHLDVGVLGSFSFARTISLRQCYDSETTF